MKENNKNLAISWWKNLKNTKENYKKVRASPYASLVLALKFRKMIIYPLILFIIWRGYDIVVSYSAAGFMNTAGKVIMFAVFLFIIYRIYSTIPQAKKQLAYYRKYPNVINYCPTDVKEDIDDIINKIKQNEINLKEAEEKNVQKKREESGKTKGSNTKKD